MEFSRQEYCSGLPFPSPGDLPHPGIEPGSPVLQADALPVWSTWEGKSKKFGKYISEYLNLGFTTALPRTSCATFVKILTQCVYSYSEQNDPDITGLMRKWESNTAWLHAQNSAWHVVDTKDETIIVVINTRNNTNGVLW